MAQYQPWGDVCYLNYERSSLDIYGYLVQDDHSDLQDLWGALSWKSWVRFVAHLMWNPVNNAQKFSLSTRVSSPRLNTSAEFIPSMGHDCKRLRFFLWGAYSQGNSTHLQSLGKHKLQSWFFPMASATYLSCFLCQRNIKEAKVARLTRTKPLWENNRKQRHHKTQNSAKELTPEFISFITVSASYLSWWAKPREWNPELNKVERTNGHCKVIRVKNHHVKYR